MESKGQSTNTDEVSNLPAISEAGDVCCQNVNGNELMNGNSGASDNEHSVDVNGKMEALEGNLPVFVDENPPNDESEPIIAIAEEPNDDDINDSVRGDMEKIEHHVCIVHPPDPPGATHNGSESSDAPQNDNNNDRAQNEKLNENEIIEDELDKTLCNHGNDANVSMDTADSQLNGKQCDNSLVEENSNDSDSQNVVLNSPLNLEMNDLEGMGAINVINDSVEADMSCSTMDSDSQLEEICVAEGRTQENIDVISVINEAITQGEDGATSRPETTADTIQTTPCRNDERPANTSQLVEDICVNTSTDKPHEPHMDGEHPALKATDDPEIYSTNETPNSEICPDTNTSDNDETEKERVDLRCSGADVDTGATQNDSRVCELEKRRTTSVCESVLTDDPDSATDAGYLASESSGMEDTGFEEGETDATYTLTSDDQTCRGHHTVSNLTGPVPTGDRVAVHHTTSSKDEANLDKASDESQHDMVSVGASIREIDDISLALSDLLSVSNDPERVNLDTSSTTVSDAPVIPSRSVSEISNSPSSVSISTETVQRHLTFSTYAGRRDSRNKVSLFMELAEAELQSDHSDEDEAEKPEVSLDLSSSHLDNIDDAEAMFDAHKELVGVCKLSTDVGEIPADPDEVMPATEEQLANEVLAASANSLFVLTNDEHLCNGMDHPEQKSQRQQEVDEVVREAISKTVRDNTCANDDKSTESRGVIEDGSTVDEPVSDVTSGQSTPVSVATAVTSSSDELLRLLDKISVSGCSMRTELDIAYDRQAFIHELGTRVEEASSNIIRNLLTELEAARMENQKLEEEVTSYRGCSRQSDQKVLNLEDLIRELQAHIEELKRSIAEESLLQQQRMSCQRTIGVGTDRCRVSSVAVQTSNHLLSELKAEFSEDLMTGNDRQIRTSTPSQLHALPLTTTSPVSSPASIQGSVKLEGEETHKPAPSRVSVMIDKILHQMNNLTASPETSLNNSLNTSIGNHDNSFKTQEVQLYEDTEPEGPEKWRRLSMTPINSDPNILTLQRSLATASFESELLQAKLKKGDKAQNRKIDELSRDVEEFKRLLKLAQDECELLKVKYDGDRAEADLLQDEIVSLEKSLSMAQVENGRLMAQLNILPTDAVPSTGKTPRMSDLELEKAKLEEEKNVLQLKLEKETDSKDKLEKELASIRHNQTTDQANLTNLTQKLSGEESAKGLLQAEVLVLREEYNYLRQGMDILEKCLGNDFTGVDRSVEKIEQDCTAWLLTGQQPPNETCSNDKAPEQQSLNQQSVNSQVISGANNGIEGKQDIIQDTAKDCSEPCVVKPQDCDSEASTESQILSANTVDVSQVGEEPNMAFPIHKAHIDELKRHVFGWRRYQVGRGHVADGQVTLPHQVLQSGLQSGANVPPVSLSLQDVSPPAVNFDAVMNSTPQSVSLNSSLSHSTHSTHSTLLSHGSQPSSASTTGGSTLHDDIMKQSEMVLDIIKESGDIQEEKLPPAVFHWQDVRNSIAHHLLNESQQKIETTMDTESTQDISQSAESKNSTMKLLLQELDKHLKKADESRQVGVTAIPAVKNEDAKAEIPDSIKVLMKAVEQELGGTVNISIQGKNGKEVKMGLDNTEPEQAIDIDEKAEREDINRRKETYRQEYDTVNAKYEELRKKRLSLLVQAYTGQQDPRPLTTKANDTNVETAETSKALALAKVAPLKSRIHDGVDATPDAVSSTATRTMDQNMFESKYLTSHDRVQRDLLALSQKENAIASVEDPSQYKPVPTSVKHSSSVEHNVSNDKYQGQSTPKENILSSTVNQTISAISQDSQLIKERIRSMREQLASVEKQRVEASRDYTVLYDTDQDDQDYTADDIMEDESEADETNPYRSPTKRPTAARECSQRYPVKVNESKSLTGSRREIYPHKKGYETPNSYSKRQLEEREQVDEQLDEKLEASLDHLDRFMDEEKAQLIGQKSSSDRGRNCSPGLSQWDDLAEDDYLAYPRRLDNFTQERQQERSVNRTHSSPADGQLYPEETGTTEKLNMTTELHDLRSHHDNDLKKPPPSGFRAVQRYKASLQNKTADMHRMDEPYQKGATEECSNISTTPQPHQNWNHCDTPRLRNAPLPVETSTPKMGFTSSRPSQLNYSYDATRSPASECDKVTLNKSHCTEKYSGRKKEQDRGDEFADSAERELYPQHSVNLQHNSQFSYKDVDCSNDRDITANTLEGHSWRSVNRSYYDISQSQRDKDKMVPGHGASSENILSRTIPTSQHTTSHMYPPPPRKKTTSSQFTQSWSQTPPRQQVSSPAASPRQQVSSPAASPRQQVSSPAAPPRPVTSQKWSPRPETTQTYDSPQKSSDHSRLPADQDRTGRKVSWKLGKDRKGHRSIRDKDSRDNLNDSINSLDSCNCTEVSVHAESYPNNKYTKISSRDKYKYNTERFQQDLVSSKDLDPSNLKDTVQCLEDSHQPYSSSNRTTELYPRESITSQNGIKDVSKVKVTHSSLTHNQQAFASSSRRSEDGESTSTVTSDGDFVVTKGGDILKRPRSTSPSQSHRLRNDRDNTYKKMESNSCPDPVNRDTSVSASHFREDTGVSASHFREDTGVSASHVQQDTGVSSSHVREDTGVSSSRVREDTGVSSSRVREDTGVSSSRVREDTGVSSSRVREDESSQYSEALLSEAINSSYRDINTDNTRWREPKRHFGLRETKTKEVRWAEPAISTPLLEEVKPVAEVIYADGILSSTKTNSHNPEECSKSDDSIGQSGTKLTDEQRQYANDLINRYTLNTECSKGTTVIEESHGDKDNQETSASNVNNPQKLSFEEKAKFINEILGRYNLDCTDEDEREISALSSQTQTKQSSFVSESEPDCPEYDGVKQVVHNVSEADEIIKKYLKQNSTPEVGAVSVK